MAHKAWLLSLHSELFWSTLLQRYKLKQSNACELLLCEQRVSTKRENFKQDKKQ